MPPSGLGTEGAGSLGTATGLSPELTVKEGRADIKQAADMPGDRRRVPEKAGRPSVEKAGI